MNHVLVSLTGSKLMAKITTNNEEGDHENLEKEELDEDNVDMINNNNNISLHTSTPNISITPSLPELNLLIILSSLSLPPGESSSDFQDIDMETKTTLKDSNDSKPNHRQVSRISHHRQREMSEFRASAPPSQRFQTKIRDCR